MVGTCPTGTLPRVVTRTNPIHDAAHLANWVLLEVGRELRLGRIRAGMTQRRVGALVGRSASRISRVERAKVPRVSIPELMKISAAVGLKLWVKPFPGGRRPIDGPQLALISTLNSRLHPRWNRRMEAVVPLPGDLRAVDELIRIDTCSCAVEAITRFIDGQAQVRSARAKQRDIKADRLILLVKASRANRRMLREAEPILSDSFPIRTRAALKSLAAGEDPGGDCLILL